MKIKYIYIKSLEIYYGFLGVLSNNILFNYCIERNAGDLFNKDYISERFYKKINKYSFGRKDHYLFCGSILARSNQYSTVVGAGFISKEQSENRIEFKKIIGVRGHLTANALLVHNPNLEIKFLGDPGLLAREIVKPRGDNYIKKDIIGIIPHFIDINSVFSIVNKEENVKIIDIRDNFKSVCKQILECDVILSSSLHGLIFADAMNVPNMWIKVSNNIKGGGFKFLDYYSVMDSPKYNFFQCDNLVDIRNAALKADVSKNPNYNEMKKIIDMVFK
ncbi:polysaccharide pyruvyl transferase family protein [Acinetobacter haemolyticus]|uniref:polysaccharide pyruvyl transferase family protein n=1 Tax=Acinetobacter haemolyticus TaxID=29430 RepID=UPI00129880EB|nr:polysaccharide pyruvyl transferase family protein [Acinetobacter haemolyticus]MQZ32254.1 polysaccharide pyruvyl transferase family protein [Acinetobacter haemolyticus]